MILGAILLGSELLVVDAAFYLVFLGVAAAITGAIVLAGVAIEPWLQFMIFGALSLASMVAFRKRFYEKLRGNAPDYPSSAAGEFIRITETLEPGKSCRQNFRGTTWTVINRGLNTIEQDTEVKVDQVDGLNIIVK